MGISLTGLTPSTTYDALIKVGDNGPIDGTLKTLSDGLGNDLPMEVSTTGVNLTGSPTVNAVAIANTTQVAAKQDTLVSGTNIKTINGASVLGSGNIAVVTSPSGVSGAIQFSDGSAFSSDATKFFWDNTNKRLGVGTNAPTRNLQVNGIGAFINSDGNTALYATNSNTGVSSVLHANCGSANMYFGGFGLLTNADSTFGQLTTLSARVGIKGSGSTSATTSLLVQNSAGSTAMEVKDNLTVGMGGAYVSGSSGFGVSVASITASYPCFLMNSTAGGGSKIGFNIDTARLYFSEETNGSSLFGHRIMADTRVGGLVVVNNTAAGVTASLNASAVLQADSTTRGFLPPRMTTTQKNAIGTPAAGLVVYDTTLAKLCVYTTAWETITSL
jgi:hypothetical protein